jgi:hypothetical protein
VPEVPVPERPMLPLPLRFISPERLLRPMLPSPLPPESLLLSHPVNAMPPMASDVAATRLRNFFMLNPFV